LSFVRRQRDDVPAIEKDRPYIRGIESRDYTQESGFSATRRTEKGEELSFLDFNTYVIEGFESTICP
jgi:hypothetical protein